MENEVKEQKGGFLGMLAAILCATLLANMLIGKGVETKIPRRGVKRPSEVNLEMVKNFNAAS